MRISSDIHDLRVVHWPKSPERGTLPDVPPGSFVIDTCIRRLCVYMARPDRMSVWPPGIQQGDGHAGPELRSGLDAYRFLLEFTTGLRSAIPGETNVFGQFKKAWLNFRRMRQDAPFEPIMKQLIEDTKLVRQDYLEGIGGSSYGSLVRKLIAPNPSDRILFVGAGALARSMLPLFSNHDLGIWNRRKIDAPTGPIERVFLPHQGKQAAIWADHVILTTPFDYHNDAKWRDWLAAARTHTVVHLGHRGSENTAQEGLAWGNATACFDLDDVFALRREKADLRSAHLKLARLACRQHAAKLTADNQRVVRNVPAINRFTGERSKRGFKLALA